MATDKLDGPRRGAESGRADALIILLHGYGANGADLFGLAEPLGRALPNAAVAAPDAPERNAFNPLGYQWFPLPWLDGSSEAEMARGFEAAKALLIAFIDAERARICVGRDRVALFGFSQGAMLTLQVGPTLDPGLAALLGFSGRLGDAARLKREKRSSPPVFLAHGALDDMVPAASMPEAEAALTDLGFSVESHLSQGFGHTITPDGFERGARFLVDILGEA